MAFEINNNMRCGRCGARSCWRDLGDLSARWPDAWRCVSCGALQLRISETALAFDAELENRRGVLEVKRQRLKKRSRR